MASALPPPATADDFADQAKMLVHTMRRLFAEYADENAPRGFAFDQATMTRIDGGMRELYELVQHAPVIEADAQVDARTVGIRRARRDRRFQSFLRRVKQL